MNALAQARRETIPQPQGAETIISTEELTKTYHTGEVEVHALRGVDLQVARGEMVAIMGPSGCGKSTLLNCLSGIDRPTAGNVIVEGQDIYKLRDGVRTDFRAKRMGFIFQFFNLLPVLSAVENVEMPLLIAGVASGKARKRALAELEMLGLASQARKHPLEMSGGQQQRIAIARSLVNDPAIVWCDEPTGNLDSETAEEILNILCRLQREKDQTFIIVTHGAEIGERADRIVQMRDGLIQSEARRDING